MWSKKREVGREWKREREWCMCFRVVGRNGRKIFCLSGLVSVK
jgi:hypothetical protein